MSEKKEQGNWRCALLHLDPRPSSSSSEALSGLDPPVGGAGEGVRLTNAWGDGGGRKLLMRAASSLILEDLPASLLLSSFFLPNLDNTKRDTNAKRLLNDRYGYNVAAGTDNPLQGTSPHCYRRGRGLNPNLLALASIRAAVKPH
ncbi:hypothetical protein F7725_009064 [Dissostichus mawsoni]|uniref:Uncharacterized protein n=1 Tax=Dissostichus mawsoni TaxID=36200 RepID=A0A7J5Z631_DISMA|nr:hypothetical protein F7725_009064 [Dissostichus mawsoni]